MHITLVHNFDLSAECGGNITNQENGVITTPNFPDKYSDSTEAANHQCHWFIHVNPGNRILLYFETFEVEGDPKGESAEADGGRGRVGSGISHKKHFFRERLSRRHAPHLALYAGRSQGPHRALRRHPGAQRGDSVAE